MLYGKGVQPLVRVQVQGGGEKELGRRNWSLTS